MHSRKTEQRKTRSSPELLVFLWRQRPQRGTTVPASEGGATNRHPLAATAATSEGGATNRHPLKGKRVHIAEEIFFKMRRWLRSLLDANEEATFEILGKIYPRDALALKRRRRSPSTPQNASPRMPLLILEVPRVRSRKIIETSLMPKPSLQAVYFISIWKP